MKEFKLGKWIKRFLLLALLFITYDSIMNRLDELYEYVLENRYEIDENINSDNFITMKDLGFEYHEVTDSRIKELDNTIDPNGKYYLLKMNNNDANNYVSINLSIYQLSTKEIAQESFESLVRVAYKNDLQNSDCYWGTCVIPNIDFETTIKYMIPVDLNVWNVDQGYSLKEINSNETNTILLLKDNQVLIINHWDNFSLNESQIQVFTDLLNKTDMIFK